MFVLKAVHVPRNTMKICQPARWNPRLADTVTRRAPFEVLDAMEPGQTVETRGNETVAFLLLWELKRSVKPGTHRQTFRIQASGDTQSLRASLTVHPAHLSSRSRLKVTNWFRLDRAINPYPSVSLWSEAHWQMVKDGLHLLYRGGQNTILVPFADNGGNLVDVTRRDGHIYRFDFSRMDRFVELARSIGYRNFEGGHVALKKDKDHPDLQIRIPKPGGMHHGPLMPAETASARRYLSQFFTALRDHLAERGWLRNWFQHVGDEPFRPVAESYCRTCDFIRSVWPDVTLTDAASTHAAAMALDIPTPEIDYLEPFQDFYRRLAKGGKAFWLYVCCCPIGRWPNRFLDFHLNKGGLLPWFCFHYGASGFLHWGANQWGEDRDVYRDPGFQGDGFILYPGAWGPIPSLRWLALRIGIEDHALLRDLEQYDPGSARRLCRRMIHGPEEFRFDVQSVRRTRRRLRQDAATARRRDS